MIQHRSPNAKPITTTIPDYIRIQAKKERMTITSLIIRGFKSMHQDTQLKERIETMERGIEKLQTRLNQRDQEVWKLQDTLEIRRK